MDVVDSNIEGIGLGLDMSFEKRETLQMHGVQTVPVFSDSSAAIEQGE
jgi:hypothetical protein